MAIRADFKFSPKAQKVAANYVLTPEEVAFADLVWAGWEKPEAYKFVYRAGYTWREDALDAEIRGICEKKGYKERIKEHNRVVKVVETVQEPTKKKRKRNTIEDDEDQAFAKATSKEGMLRDLIAAREKVVFGNKEWLEYSKMIADITKMKNDEIISEDDTVHFYVPLRCHQCELYAKHKKEVEQMVKNPE